MKKILTMFAFVLSGCTPIYSNISIRSDLDFVSKKNKDIFYDLKDSSIVAARINRIIRRRLQETGWTIYVNPKSVNYSYSIITYEKEYIQNQISNIGNATYLTQRGVYFPIVFFRIQNTVTKENVYEARVILSSNYGYGNLEKFTEVAAPALFKGNDAYRDIECVTIYPENQKEYESCVLKVPNE